MLLRIVIKIKLEYKCLKRNKAAGVIWKNYKITNLEINDIIEDPELTHNAWIENIKLWLETYHFPKHLINKIVKSSKMKNWPQNFKSKDLIKQNKEEFKKLGKKI